MNGIKLMEKKSISLRNKLLEYNKPDLVYIPLVNHSNFDCEAVVQPGDLIHKGSVIGRRNDSINFDIHSSVSGKVLEIGKCIYLNGKYVNCVVIENDFSEKQDMLNGQKEKITNYSKEQFLEILKNCSVTGMGGADFPTYIKYQQDLNTIIVNAVECEPYLTSDHMISKLYTEEILEAVDAIMEINHISRGYIAVKENNEELKTLYLKYLGTYPAIKLFLVSDVYPMGWEKYLISEILNKKYANVPSEIGVVCNNVSTIYAIYKALKYKKPISRRIVTVSGDRIKKPCNMIIKIGSKMSEVMKGFDEYQGVEELFFVAGGPMMGQALPSDELVVTKNLNAVLVLDKKTVPKPVTCLRCARCSNVCPVKISPVLVMNSSLDFEKIKELHPEYCIECGLCSYVCPSKIGIREFVKTAKEEIRRH